VRSSVFDINTYDYYLPQKLIAQVPTERRDHSRLLVLKRRNGSRTDCSFYHLPELLSPGDLLVVNDTRVIPARLFGHKETGGKVEVLVLYDPDNQLKEDKNIRLCLMKSSKRPHVGMILFFEDDLQGEVVEVCRDGLVRILFKGYDDIDSFLDDRGTLPLPPYIKRQERDPLSALDRERYQTVFSRQRGAVAAPTASLHFTDDLVLSLQDAGISIVTITLHVGYGTFRPVRTADIRRHELGKEFFSVTHKTAQAINATKQRGGRVVAVGTTVVRTLETLSDNDGFVTAGDGATELLITPDFKFRAVDAMITNFHLPKSSLLFLVAAFAGIDLIMETYAYAVEKSYRFYSYGDVMLIL